MNLQNCIEKLKGVQNYASWAFEVQAYLEHEGLWKCISGEETDQLKLTQAKSKLILLIDKVNHHHILNAKNAEEIWTKLQETFQDNGLTRRVGLLRTLLNTKLIDCSSVDDYVSKVTTTAYKLSGCGLTVGDEWVGAILLAGLPESYSPMIMGLESSGTKLTGENIKAKLLQNVKAITPNSSETALVTSKVKNPNKSKGARCYNCNGYGHFAKHCKKKKMVKSQVRSETTFYTSLNAQLMKINGTLILVLRLT